MALTLIRNAAVVAAMDDAGSEIAGGAVALRDGVILAVGTTPNWRRWLAMPTKSSRRQAAW